MLKITLPKITDIRKKFNQFTFDQHEVFHWSPKNNCIYYDPNKLDTPEGILQLLHEIGHAVLEHTNYGSGVQLLKMETEAWQKAKELSEFYNLEIKDEQIERCLDSYRDWLHLRSTCPRCTTISVETESNHYRCFNCLQTWKVPADQRTRSYRLKLVNQLV
jgi:hypothetical protein